MPITKHSETAAYKPMQMNPRTQNILPPFPVLAIKYCKVTYKLDKRVYASLHRKLLTTVMFKM